jgi:hypothetical protein
MPPAIRPGKFTAMRKTRSSSKMPTSHAQTPPLGIGDSVINISSDDEASSAPKPTRKRAEPTRAGAAGAPPRKRKATPVRDVTNAEVSEIVPEVVKELVSGTQVAEGSNAVEPIRTAELARLQQVRCR